MATSVRSAAAGSVGPRRDRGAERPRQGVGRQVGGVELARAQAAQLGGDRGAADAGGVQDARAADQLDRGAGGGDRRAAAARLEARVRDAVALDGDREPHEVAAGGAAGRAVEGARGLVAAPARVAQVVGEALVGHRARGV